MRRHRRLHGGGGIYVTKSSCANVNLTRDVLNLGTADELSLMAGSQVLLSSESLEKGSALIIYRCVDSRWKRPSAQLYKLEFEPENLRAL